MVPPQSAVGFASRPGERCVDVVATGSWLTIFASEAEPEQAEAEKHR